MSACPFSYRLSYTKNQQNAIFFSVTIFQKALYGIIHTLARESYR